MHHAASLSQIDADWYKWQRTDAALPPSVLSMRRSASLGPDGHGSPPSTVLSRRYDSRLRFPWAYSFAVRYRVFLLPSCCRWRAPGMGQVPCRGLIGQAGLSPSSRRHARTKPPRFPGGPSRSFATVPRSRSARLACSGVSGAATAFTKTKAPALRISGLNSVASLLAVYASRPALPHATLASGWRAAPLPGGSSTRWTASKSFRHIMTSSLPELRLALCESHAHLLFRPGRIRRFWLVLQRGLAKLRILANLALGSMLQSLQWSQNSA